MSTPQKNKDADVNKSISSGKRRPKKGKPTLTNRPSTDPRTSTHYTATTPPPSRADAKPGMPTPRTANDYFEPLYNKSSLRIRHTNNDAVTTTTMNRFHTSLLSAVTFRTSSSPTQRQRAYEASVVQRHAPRLQRTPMETSKGHEY